MKEIDIKVGDKVTTEYHPLESSIVFTVANIERYSGHSQTGWKVTAVDDKGRKLSCDSAWFKKVG